MAMLSLQAEIAQMMNNKCSHNNDNNQFMSTKANNKKDTNLTKVRKLFKSATTKSILNSSFNDKNLINNNNISFSYIDIDYNNLNNSSVHLIFLLFHLIQNLFNDILSKTIGSIGKLCFVLNRKKILVILIRCKCLKILN
jgi:hypothetical protein